MNAVISAEWRKLRSVRSTRYVLASTVLALVAGSGVAALMTADWDGASVAERATFTGADPAILAVPFAQFCLAALGALMITTEYSSGTIRLSLAAVPRRHRLLAAKAAVIGAVAFVTGQVIALAALLLGRLIAGDRPAPIAAFSSVPDGLPDAFAAGLSVTVIGLVGLGAGTMLRSTASALVTIGTVMFVLPVFARFVFPAQGEAIASLLPTGLAPQIAGSADDPALPPLAAFALLAAYAAAALAAAATALTRRDA
ncbi:ABC transporter permease [Spirillospora sp. NPDC047279]|uniref:ABC transporter permease n=1 Tax=Spirillospora sp. NPDC047279 TaxID=3155478 RepID=UPI0033CD8F24